ncbi:MAG: hypothetical protein M5U34_17680 [Chloroflexi bacterium]|nr:hypothetical protein [Chloroflexota bacterium]
MNNDNGAKQRDRQRLAWIVLLGSSGLCLLLTIAVPLSINAALHNMKRPLTTIVQANQGTVRVDDASTSPPFSSPANRAKLLTTTHASSPTPPPPPPCSSTPMMRSCSRWPVYKFTAAPPLI